MENKERMREIFEHISDFPAEQFRSVIIRWRRDMGKLIMLTPDQKQKIGENLKKAWESRKAAKKS